MCFIVAGIIITFGIVFGIPHEGYCEGKKKKKEEKRCSEIEQKLRKESKNMTQDEFEELFFEQQLLLKKSRECGSPYPEPLESYHAFFVRLGYGK